jgi:hypothetical protein
MTSTWEAMQSRDTLMHSEIINTGSSPGNMSTFSTSKKAYKALSTGIFLQDLFHNIVSYRLSALVIKRMPSNQFVMLG